MHTIIAVSSTYWLQQEKH